MIQVAGGGAPTSDTKSHAMTLVSEAYESTPAQVLRELEAMEGSFCVRAVQDGEPHWRYRHPTIGEAVASVAANSPALLDVYLAGTDVRRVLQEAVCAGVSKVEGAIIQVGGSRYDALIERINAAGWMLEFAPGALVPDREGDAGVPSSVLHGACDKGTPAGRSFRA